MCNGLTEAGATLKWVYDPDPAKVAAFQAKFPQAKVARSVDEILGDPEVPGRLVRRHLGAGPLGCRVMEAGKDYFSDKAPFTTLAQLEQARAVVARTGRKYMVYYSERLHNESAMFATDLVAAGRHRPGDPGAQHRPHRLARRPGRPGSSSARSTAASSATSGSHQFEQFLTYSGARTPRSPTRRSATSATPTTRSSRTSARPASRHNGPLNYVRVDWFTPDGLGHLGRRPHLHPRHQGHDRAAQVHRRRPGSTRGRPCLHRRREGTSTPSRSWRRQGRLPVFRAEFILDCLNAPRRP
jgi:hypothetical protein